MTPSHRSLAATTIALLLFVSAPVHASPPQPSPQPRPAPPRDAAQKEQKGTAVIRGRVVAQDSGRPLRRARITIISSELGQDSRRTTSTNLDGRYEFKDLPAARFRVSVTRGGYLPLDYGQQRPGEQGRPVQLAGGQELEKIDFVLPRMSLITGRVTDETAEPIEGVSVYAMRSMFYEGRRKLVPVTSPARTDDAGEYRILRLPPGTYVVMASIKETWTVTEDGKETVFGYMPTYFPGVSNGTDARRVTLGVGQEASATDFPLVPGRAAKVSGVALDSQRQPFKRVSMSEEVRGTGFASFGAGPSATVSPDGTFTISNVAPGEYTMSASRMPSDGDLEVAIMTVFIDGTDLENVSLVGSGGGVVSGRVVVEGDSAPKMSAVRVSITEPLRNQRSPVLLGVFRSGDGPSQTAEDGSFSIPHVFGRARFLVTLPEGWMLKSVTHDGRDITDTTLELKNGEKLTGVQVAITNQVTSISGVLLDDKREPIRDATVLVFASEPHKWLESSRVVSATRPDQQGQWRFRALPPGEYLAIAMDYIEDGAWNDPEYLESLRRDAQRVMLAEGASQTVALKLVVPKQD